MDKYGCPLCGDDETIPKDAPICSDCAAELEDNKERNQNG